MAEPAGRHAGDGGRRAAAGSWGSATATSSPASRLRSTPSPWSAWPARSGPRSRPPPSHRPRRGAAALLSRRAGRAAVGRHGRGEAGARIPAGPRPRRTPERHRQHRRRPRAVRPPRQPRPRQRPVHPGRPRRPGPRLGRGRRHRPRPAPCSSATARKRGSGSATRTSGPSSAARPSSAEAQPSPRSPPTWPPPSGVRSPILPATDDRLRTRILTDGGDLEFQRYFVERGQRDEVRGISFEGAAEARPTEAVLDALRDADLVVIGPSNPLVSIGPMLAMTELQRSRGRRIREAGGGQPHRRPAAR